VAGLGKIVREAYPDNFAFKKDHKYYDSRSTSEKPLWFMVDVGFVGKFKNLVSLDQIKNEKALEGIMVAKKGSRLSVQPISEAHFKHICKMADYK
jgi:predicted RNA-binding protein with PUA-like domain